MPLSSEAVRLDAGPRSVHQARTWALDVCRGLDREDLVESTQLAVSELVTNALLHAQPPVELRVRGTRAHPRFEVRDGSRVVPTPPSAALDVDDVLDAFDDLPDGDEFDELALLSTVGRGLGLVAMASQVWGVDLLQDGKVVWFEPVADAEEGAADRAGARGITHDPILSETVTDPGPRADLRYVRVPGVPVRRYHLLRRHYRELRRELRLLALAHEADYPLSRELTSLFERFDDDVHALSADSALDAALAAGDDVVDVEVWVSSDFGAASRQMLELLDLADAFCRTQRLLALERSPGQRRFQEWLLGELAGQLTGRPVAPWVEEDAASDRGHAS